MWVLFFLTSVNAQNLLPCYVGTTPYACEPPVSELAHKTNPKASSVCGLVGDGTFLQISEPGNNAQYVETSCTKKDRDGRLIYGPEAAVDGLPSTYWVSSTLYDSRTVVTDPTSISNDLLANFTLDLGIVSNIESISIVFRSPRPHSMVIYARESKEDDWKPLQYFSSRCYSVFNKQPWLGGSSIVDTSVKCDQSQSDYSPITRGAVEYFAPSNNKPRVRYVLLSMVKVHSIDSVSTSTEMRDLKKFYYAVQEVNVRGTCMCNGHANQCDISDPLNKVCLCEHYTGGVNCESCLRFYDDKPWQSMKLGEKGFECKQCDCNGKSAECVFDANVWQSNGNSNGGVCLNCMDDTAGQNCDTCKSGFYFASAGTCQQCGCNLLGSISSQCDSQGRCTCKPGVTGNTCNQCRPGYYGFGSSEGCVKCQCDSRGTRYSTVTCDPSSGACPCKDNAYGQTCSECKPGFFDLSEENSFGCRSCFCFGHSQNCSESNQLLSVREINSEFSSSGDQYGLDIAGWQASDLQGTACRIVLGGSISERHLSIDSSFANEVSRCSLRSYPESFIYFKLPKSFLGNKLSSYGLTLSFELRPIGSFSSVKLSDRDVIIEGLVGDSVKRVSAGLDWQGNKALKARQWNQFSFRLLEGSGWDPVLSPVEFQSMLLNVQRILIRGAYGQNACDLKNVVLQYSEEDLYPFGSSSLASEKCECPQGFTGSSCEQCEKGYRRVDPKLGALSPCVKCECNGHASDCDPFTGVCLCGDNTMGHNCEECEDGYYGMPFKDSSASACKPCPCSIVTDPSTGLLRNGKCQQSSSNGQVMCIECPNGYTGSKCEICANGFYKRGNKCIKCDCNGNVDKNNIGFCDQFTGKCNQCLNNTLGDHCEKCLDDHFGSALDNPSSCKPCDCLPEGSSRDYAPGQTCSPFTGACVCKSFVVGRRCDSCVEGYFGVLSGNGCSPCDCDPVGSQSPNCDVITGQCTCLPNVAGRKCDQCASGTFGLASSSSSTSPEDKFEGCQECECDARGLDVIQGSVASCDEMGHCGPCRENVTGKRCDQCVENHYKESYDEFDDTPYECKRCDSCYDFVQVAANDVRRLAQQLSSAIIQIQSTPVNFSGENFEQKLSEITRLAIDTLSKANSISKSTKNLTDYVDKSDIVCDDILYKLDSIRSILEELKASNESNQNALDKLSSHVEETEEYVKKLNYEVSEGEELLLLVEDTANQIRANKSALLDKLRELESIVSKHVNDSHHIAESTQYSQNFTAEALRLLNLVQTFATSLEEKTRIINRNLASIDPGVSELLQKYYDFVLMVYEMTLRIYNEVNQPVPQYNFQPYIQQAAQLNATLERLESNLRAENETNSNLALSSSGIRSEIDILITTSRELNRNLSIYLVQLYELEKGLNETVNRVTEEYYTGLQRLDLLKGYQNASGSGQADSFEQEYLRIPGIRDQIEAATEKSQTGTSLERQYKDQVEAVHQNAQLVLDEITRKKEAVEDVSSKLEEMRDTIGSEKQQVKLMQSEIDRLDTLCNRTLPLQQASSAQKKASDDAALAEKKSKELRGVIGETKQQVEQLRDLLSGFDFLSPDEVKDFEDTLAKLAEIAGGLDLQQMQQVAEDAEQKAGDMDDLLQLYEKRYLEALKNVQNAEEIASNVKVICQSITTPIS